MVAVNFFINILSFVLDLISKFRGSKVGKKLSAKMKRTKKVKPQKHDPLSANSSMMKST